MNRLFRQRRQEHRQDDAIRRDTLSTLQSHKTSLKRVRATLASADETLADELRRLDAAIKRNNEGVGL